DDNFGPINGADGGTTASILGNDTLNGDPVDPSDVTLTVVSSDPELTLNPDGTITVAPNTPAGDYELTYSICEVLNPGNCDTATVIVIVIAPEIIANDDDFGIHFVSFSGSLGNILENDLLNRERPNPEQVEFEFIDLDGIQGLFIDFEGNMSLLIPGINEAREYRLRYVLRDANNPDNFDEAFVIFTLLRNEVDLEVTKTSNQVELWEGDVFEYAIQVSNIGGTNATDVIIEDLLPDGVMFINQVVVSSISGLEISFLVQGNRLIWSLPELPADVVLDIMLRVQAEPLSGSSSKTITNVVNVTSEETDVNLANNSDSDVNIIRPFFIPNVITPDGDGKNDTFKIMGIGKFVSNRIVIFNRYGDHVFRTENYKNDWDAPGLVAGTYFYIFTAIDNQGKSHEFKGWIQVVKN
ncbi:T9SS type B sorting domain-containing protein, partial [Mongoliitalea lutea]